MSFDNLKSIISKPNPLDPHRRIVITEKNNKDSNSLKKVIIRGFESEACSFWFSIDGYQELCPYIKGGHFTKRCDAILIHAVKGRIYILLIELKSSAIKRIDIKNKFKSSFCFLQYLSSILKEFFDDDLIEKAQKRYILFHRKTPIPIPKSVTQFQPVSNKKFSTPEDYMNVYYEKEIRIKKLI